MPFLIFLGEAPVLGDPVMEVLRIVAEGCPEIIVMHEHALIQLEREEERVDLVVVLPD